MNLDNGTWVLVADGAKALTLVNEGDTTILNLRRVTVEAEHHERTGDLGADRPGRTHQSADNRRSSMEETDRHAQAETDFVRGVATWLDLAAQHDRFSKLVIVAAPRALADLRAAFTQRVQDRIVAELPKDLTGHPIPSIEKIISTA